MPRVPVPAPSITPHLWFDKEAAEAARFYSALFPGSAVEHIVEIRDTPSGDCEAVYFRLGGKPFLAISAGPRFRSNPSISFIVNFDARSDPQARARLDETWAKLSAGGRALMPLDAYPFSPRYGWMEDRYGLSWQLILSNPQGDPRPLLTPALLFTGEVDGRAEEAGTFYRSVFADSEPGRLVRFPPEMGPELEGKVMYSEFRLGDTWFAAMDGGPAHDFRFNEAISFVVHCRGQNEIDFFWDRLSAVPEAEACGWLKDRFGVSWQIVPAELKAMMSCGDRARVDRLTRAFLAMKKLELAPLRAAWNGPGDG